METRIAFGTRRDWQPVYTVDGGNPHRGYAGHVLSLEGHVLSIARPWGDVPNCEPAPKAKSLWTDRTWGNLPSPKRFVALSRAYSDPKWPDSIPGDFEVFSAALNRAMDIGMYKDLDDHKDAWSGTFTFGI